MKFRSLLTLFALLLCVSLSAQATERAKERAKNRAENRANRKVDQKIDGAVDDAFDAIGSLFKKKKKKKNKGGAAEEPTTDDQPAANRTGGLFGGGNWEPYTNPVSFSVQMEMTEVKKNGKATASNMSMAVVSDKFGILFKEQDSGESTRMILNTQDGKTTMITTDKKGKTEGFRMKMPGIRSLASDANEETMEGITFENTGETKVIDGYNCTKYIVNDSKNNITTESWVTTDANINAQDIFAGMMNAFGAQANKQKGPANGLAGGYEGFPILTISDDGKSTYTCRYRNLKVGEASMDKSILDVSNVKIQSLGF